MPAASIRKSPRGWRSDVRQAFGTLVGVPGESHRIMAGENTNAIGHQGLLAGGDSRVRRDPARDLPLGRSISRPGRVRLVDRLVVKAYRLAGDPGHQLCGLGECECFRPGEVERLSRVAIAQQHRGDGIGDVIAEHRGRASVTGGAGNRAVGQHHARNEVDVQGHAQEGEGDAAAADALLRCVVVAREREDRVGRRTDQRQGDQTFAAGSDDRVDRHPRADDTTAGQAADVCVVPAAPGSGGITNATSSALARARRRA